MTSPFQREPPSRDPGRRDLGDLLLEERFITEGVLRAARRLAKRERLPMVVVLLEGGHVSEVQIVDILSRRAKLQIIDPQRVTTDEDIIREMPYDLAEKHRALPLSLERDPLRKGGKARLRVALADPLDREALEEIEAVTGHHVEPVIASAGPLLNAIRFHYRGSLTRGGPPAAEPVRRPRDEPPEHTTLPSLPAAALAAALKKADGAPAWAIGDEDSKPGDHVTQPLKPDAEEAPLEIRLRALLNVLIETGILSERVYQEAVARLLRGGS